VLGEGPQHGVFMAVGDRRALHDPGGRKGEGHAALKPV
jgi:hypothetical protein